MSDKRKHIDGESILKLIRMERSLKRLGVGFGYEILYVRLTEAVVRLIKIRDKEIGDQHAKTR